MKSPTSLILAAAVLAAVASVPAQAAMPAPTLDPSIVLVIESPGDDASGIGLVSGYAISKKGAIDYVTWEVDGVNKGLIPYGGSRGDVEQAFPGYANSAAPGFATAWNWSHFEAGDHEIVIKAYDDRGGYNEVKKTFRTARFGDGDDKFLKADELELQGIPINGLRLYPQNENGDVFNLELAWSAASQQFLLKRIDEVCTNCAKPKVHAPTLDTVAHTGGGWVEVTWSGGDSVVAYLIERKSHGFVGGDWELAGTVSGAEAAFYDQPPRTNTGVISTWTTYEYRVRGLGASNRSDYSNTDMVVVP